MSRDHNHPSVHPTATSNVRIALNFKPMWHPFETNRSQSSTSATNGIKPASSGSSANSTGTVTVAVVVGLLLLTIIVYITITEYRKMNTTEGLRVRTKEGKELALVANGSRESFESFESELKEPAPAVIVFSRIAS
ncbi:hypothetical protein CPAR01_09920 [Colletotrichum paranaense]|uniref:Uncharacterized protein n=1 Tax=Colletotrichum paranaense TaxID=1914294 RepID=A0ABQ9SCI6_9PEZI|nr:uncharacterized protein CPAR01_09920 [Colletotrichum paranaense]KAK1533212.1 hypothetical protein CPAR01_09920 [Colletotrichum paranaense]